MIRVLIVDDSEVAQNHLEFVLSSDPDIKVVGIASNGEEAIHLSQQLKPDVVTMDIMMPKLNGFETTSRIMQNNPVPIVIVSGYCSDPKEANMSFRAMEAGAVAVIDKPKGIGHPDYQSSCDALIRTVKTMSEVIVIKRWGRSPINNAVKTLTPTEREIKLRASEIKLVAIGASTGGPPVLQSILSELPKNYKAPVLIVQHIAEGFIKGLVEWLEHTSALPVHIASEGDLPEKGHVYIAPDGFHMTIAGSGKIRLISDPPYNGHRPSVSYLFRTAAECYGSSAVGVLLTGMGKDGAEELKLMKERGAVTFAQDESSSVVHGMPGEAIKLNGATYVLPPAKIAAALKMMALGF